MQLNEFIELWRTDYQLKLKRLKMFGNFAPQIELEFQSIIAKRFLHARGNYYETLWYLMSLLEDEDQKRIVWENVKDELAIGERINGLTHDRLYWNFLVSIGISLEEIQSEIFSKKNYTPMLKKFNDEIRRFIFENIPGSVFSFFAAYEYLDNIDYPLLTKFFSRFEKKYFNDKGKDLSFFKVHSNIEHCGTEVMKELEKIWKDDPISVINGFTFVSRNQFLMWNGLIE